MTNKVLKSEAEWQQQLSPEAYRVLRRKGTERAFTNDDFPKKPGTFRCAGVNLDSVEEHADNGFFMKRVEVVCATCDGHLGHVFPDGPKPTGQRYCMNGVALSFEPEE